MKEEAEKEKIRRLMRDSRLQGDRQAEMEEKRKELERLQRLT